MTINYLEEGFYTCKLFHGFISVCLEFKANHDRGLDFGNGLILIAVSVVFNCHTNRKKSLAFTSWKNILGTGAQEYETFPVFQ